MDDAAAIRALISPWIQACKARDWDALLALCTDDIVFAPPGEPHVSGPSAIRTWMDAFPVIGEFTFAFDQVEVDGALGVGIGTGYMSAEVEGEATEMNFKFVDVLRKLPDGSWRFSHASWSPNES